MAVPQRASRTAARPRLLVVLTLTAMLATGTALPAAADPTPPPPSQDEVDSARQSVVDAAASVAFMDVQMAELTARQDAAFNAAAAAGEAYIQAVVDFDAATVAAADAQTRSDSATGRAEESRKILVALARDSSRNGGGLAQLGTYLTADGITEAVSTANAMALVSSKSDKAAQQFQADSVVSSTLEGLAVQAVADLEAKKDAASAALEATQTTQAEADQAVATAAVDRESLLTQLAAARSTSIEVEQARQQGLQAERDAAAERLARDRVAAAAEASPGTPATPPAAGTTPPVTTAPAPVPTTPGAPATTPPTVPTAAPPVAPPAVVPPTTAPTTPPPAVRPTTPPVAPPVAPPVTPPVAPPVTPPAAGGGLGTGSSRSTAAQGQAAVDWAKTKLGLPYVWGATGPDSYDCSGLTSRAWGAAGISINRTSRDQYKQVLKISLDSMRPGDLVFWGNNPKDPSTITHVALYAGNNQIVEASKPGVPLRVTAMRWDNRLMPFAGRP